uniref:COR domain-containing protein n=1 Tax=Amphimedon queenslandica TaxID=400682 RepID=A0A1X7USS3_AMPQE
MAHDRRARQHRKEREYETHEKNEELITPQPKIDYDKKVAEKEVEVAYSRIMLLGSAGVGKTCFTRSLMEKPFQKDTDSTIVSELHSIVPVRRLAKPNNDQHYYGVRDRHTPSRRSDYDTPDDPSRPDRFIPSDEEDFTSLRGNMPPPNQHDPRDFRFDQRRPDQYKKRDDYPSPDRSRPDDYTALDYNRSDYYSSPDHRRPDDYPSRDRYKPDYYSTPDHYERSSHRPDNPEDVSSSTRRFIGGQQPQPHIDFTPLQYRSPPDHREKEPRVRGDRPFQYSAHMLSDKKWKEVDENDEIEEVARLIAAVYGKSSGSEDLRTAVAASSLYKVDSSLSLSELSVRENQKKEVDLFLAKAIKRAQEIEPVPIQDIKPQPFMHIWDCGGQAVFLEILPAFLTPRTLFFLIFNAAKSLDEKWENIRNTKGNMVCDNLESISTKNLLFNWMVNIHHHLAQLNEKKAFLSYPRIYCIGTHGDLIKGDKQTTAIKNIESALYRNEAFSYLIMKVLIVDNTTAGSGSRYEDQNFSTIREEVSDFTSNKLIVKTPVSWVLFRKVIKRLGKKVISLKEAHEIGLACKIPLNDVPKALLFYHDLGVLLYYPFIKGLKDRVIIKPQWFVETLGKVFTLEGKENQDAQQARSMWSLLRDKGILVQPLYQEVWGDCKEIEADDLMELLVHFRLAAEVKTDQYYIANVKQYFLPAVLKLYDISSPHSIPDDQPVARATNLHITFSTDFVPPGFFTRFIASFANASVNAASANAASSYEICFKEKYGVFRNRIMFGDPNIKVTVSDFSDTIQVSVECYISTSFSNTCQELKKLVERCCSEVDKSLANQCNSSKTIEIKRKFRFECTACDKYEPHYIISAASGQTADSLLQCQKSKMRRRPTLEESYWFPEGDKTAQNVPVSISEQEMLIISQRVSDKADSVAAGLNMFLRLNTLRQDHHDNPMLHLLFEWNRGGGRREDLVKTLKDVNLDKLADQVQNSNYIQLSRPPSVISTSSRQQTLDPPSGAESSGIEGTEPIEFQVTEATKADQSKKFAKMVLEVIKEYEKSKEPDDQVIVNQGEHETQSGDQCQERRRQGVEPQQRQQQQRQQQQRQQQQRQQQQRQQHQRQQEVQIQQGSQPQEHIRSDISDNDLLRSAKYLKPEHVKKFAEVYDDDSRYLHSELEKYENSDAQTKGFHVLRAMLRRNPNVSHDNLKESLSLLGFHDAAKNLSPSTCLLI